MDEIAADWLLINGRIRTFDRARPLVTALVVRDGRVAATGTPATLRPWRGRHTRVLDLGGATVIPGLVDAHAHLDREGLKFLYPSPARCRSLAELQAFIRRLARERPAGEWIVTMPLGTPPFYRDAPGLREGRWPTRADLDAAAPDHPVYIRGIWGYWNKPPIYSVANSRALARAGITRATGPPRGVEIVKDGAGEPAGLFVEHNVIQVLEFTLMRDVPRFRHEDRVRALAVSQRRYAARGVTAVYEGHGVAPEVLRVYREARAGDALALRCTLAVSPTWDGVAEARRAIPDMAAWAGGRGVGDERLRVQGICLHYGGDPEVARILHASQPYTGWAGFVESANGHEEYREQAALAARHGLRVNTLITRSLSQVLDVWAEISRETSLARQRWVLVHLNVATAADVAKARRLGAVATTNPISYLWRSAGEEAKKIADANLLIPHRSLARARIPFGIATDNKPPDPWLAFRAVIARQDMESGDVVGARERLSREQALRALTAGGAYVTFAERDRGTLAPGRAADLAVLDRDPLSAPLDEVADLTCLLTMVGGRVVHGRAEAFDA
jgi:predicted amidohydrolase YtcJ